MRRHHGVELQLAVGLEVGRQFGQAALVDRDRHVRVGLNPAVAREMLAAAGHAGVAHAFDQRAGQCRHGLRICVEGAIADHAAASPVEVEHRREGKIDAECAQFRRQQVADVACADSAAARRRLVPPVAEVAHGRQQREAIAAALHAAPFVVDGDQQRWLRSAWISAHQRLQLLRRLRSCG